MTAFTVTAWPFEAPVQVTWADGELAGDPDAINVVKAMARRWDGRYIGTPRGPINHNHLADPHAALVLIRLALGDTTTLSKGRVA